MAIARDATSGQAPSSSSTWTLSHTCASGSSLFVVIEVNSSTDVVTSVTYNSVSMTQLASRRCSKFGGAAYLYIYFLATPTSGSNNIVVSLSSAKTGVWGGVSYTGVGATQPDSTAQNTATTTGSGTPFTLTTSVVASGCWLLSITKDSSGGSSAGSGTTRISPLSSGFGEQWWDSNGTVSSGSRSLNMTNATNPTDWDGIIISIAPPSVGYKNLLLLGVG